MSTLEPMSPTLLPPGVRARIVPGTNGLDMHLLEAGWEQEGRPVLLLLHGFPELAYSWRHVMQPLADAGYRVLAPDQRGYGRTCVAPVAYDADLGPFRILNLVRDMVALAALAGVHKVDCVIGHDYGASIAAACALVRPDLFRSVIVMSAPFAGPPAWPLASPPSQDPIARALAELGRKHYHAYFATREADGDMRDAPQGLPAFLRAYFHFKSGDWRGNQPFELHSWSADELAKMPSYYILPLALGMADAVAPEMPGAAEIAGCTWLPDHELRVYADEYARTGFQGGLNWYRGRMNGNLAHDLALFSGRTIDVPAQFIAGAQDWGSCQVPGGLQRMRGKVFSNMREHRFVAGAGHWVQQERPAETVAQILDFIASVPEAART